MDSDKDRTLICDARIHCSLALAWRGDKRKYEIFSEKVYIVI